MRVWLISLLLMTLLCSGALLAEESQELARSWDFGIGIGYGEQSNPFIAADDVPGFVTLDLAIYGERFFFDNGDLGFTLVDRPEFGLNLLATYSSERIYYSYFNELGLFRNSGLGFRPGSDELVVVPAEQLPQAGVSTGPPGQFAILELPDRDFALNVGVELLWNWPQGQLQWQVLQDVSGAHQGLETDLTFSKSWHSGRWAFKPSIGLSWQSGKLVDYYYGVNNRDQLFELVYAGEATTHVTVGMLVSYRINNRLSYVTRFSHTQLGSAVRNSPLIDADHTQAYFSGLFYRF
jgi:outer membrane protein